MLFHHGQQTCWPFAWMVVIELAGVACGASLGLVAQSSNAQPTNTRWVRDVRDQPFGTIDCPYVGATSFVLWFLLQPLVVAELILGALVGWGIEETEIDVSESEPEIIDVSESEPCGDTRLNGSFMDTYPNTRLIEFFMDTLPDTQLDDPSDSEMSESSRR